MAYRTIYSCDWCAVDSAKPGFVGEGWQQLEMLPYYDKYTVVLEGKVWLCRECVQALSQAIVRVRSERAKVRRER